MGLALIAVMELHLVAALLAGLLVFQLVHMLADAVRIPHINNRYAKVLFVALLAIVVVTALTFLGIGIGVFLRRGPEPRAPALRRFRARSCCAHGASPPPSAASCWRRCRSRRSTPC